MNVEITSGTLRALRLGRGQTLRLRDGVGSTICADEGMVWITEENSRKDVVLQNGGCHRIANPGLTIVQAFADAQVSLA